MIRMLLAATAAVALAAASPALGCPDCHDCPMHKDKVAAADRDGKKDAEKKAACACAGEGKDCRCGAQCECAHCGEKKAEKKAEGAKKS
jgi:hypothetical protein